MIDHDLRRMQSSLEKERRLFAKGGHLAREAHCCLLLAQLYHRLEDLHTAALYTEEAVSLLQHSPSSNPSFLTDVYLGLARLAPDIGQYIQGEVYAQQAWDRSKEFGDPSGEFEALMMLTLIARQTGRYWEARGHLERIYQQGRAIGLDPQQRVRLLNSETHIEWYCGHLERATELAAETCCLADRTHMEKQQVYAHLLLGNLYRARGDFPAAHDWYDGTERRIQETNFPLFLPWLQVQRAWLETLEGEYDRAKQRLFCALESADRGQAMSFNIFLGGVYSLTGRYLEAEDLFHSSLAFYEGSGDPLSVCTLQIHLAYVGLKRGNTEQAHEFLGEALAWMAEHNLNYLPHWWHPGIMANVCAQALVAGIAPTTVERICAAHLQDTAPAELRALLRHPAPAVRRRAGDLLNLLDVDLLDVLAPVQDETVRAVLEDLLRSGQLQPDAFSHLAQKLTTAHQQKHFNPVLVATFGLYLQGHNRREIARRLQRAESTIRNYITVLYESFGLSNTSLSRQQRRAQLRDLAREEGFLCGI